jgi:O-antigen ligase
LVLYGLSIFAGLETTVNYGGMRFRGFLLDPNGYAGLIGAAAIFQIAILNLKPKRGLSGILQTLNCFALLSGCFLTLSRGGLISLFVGGFVLMIFTKARRSFSIVLVFAGLVAAIFFLSSKTDLTSAVNRRTDDRENIDSRVDYMEQGMRMYLDSPVSMATGIGIGTFVHESPKFFGDQHQIHNTYVWLLVEGGPLILGAYLLLLYRALKNSYWVYRHAPKLQYAGAGCFCALVATIVWCMTVEGMYHHHVWILLAFSELLYAHSRKSLVPRQFRVRVFDPRRAYVPAFTQAPLESTR